MTRLRVAARLLEIHRALVRHGLDDFVRATHLYRPFRFLFYLSPWTWFQRSEGATRGERLRLALEELGPIFVKFGQAVSTRRDLLPVDIADELAKLQDRVLGLLERVRHAPIRALVDQRADERSVGERVADRQSREHLGERAHELVGDRLVRDHAPERRAPLAGSPRGGEHDAAPRELEVRGRRHHRGVVAAELEQVTA